MLRKLLLAATLALAAALPAQAQGPLGIWPEPPEELIREALATPYAAVLLRTFAASVRKDGDPACLQAKALDDVASVARGRALLQRYGVQMMKVLNENFDQGAYRAALSVSAGPDALAEIERLKGDNDVKAIIALDRPARLAKVVDTVLEQFDRYVLVGRIKLGTISPIGRGEPEPPENPTQAAEAAVQRYVDEHPSEQVERYFDLLDAVEAATPKGFTPAAATKIGPMAFFGGADRDLANLCIGRR